jgi:hypothetical protein
MKRVNKDAAVWNLVGIRVKYVSFLGLFLQGLMIGYIEQDSGRRRGGACKWAAV